MTEKEKHSLHIDLETRSLVDLRTYGQWVYAEHESTEIVILACAKDDGEVVSWDITQPTLGNEALSLYRQAVGEGWKIYAHNIDFEYAVLKHNKLNLPAPKIQHVRCTQAMCNIAAIPPSLEDSASFLGLTEGKDTRGKRLIGIFSKPTPEGGFREPFSPGVFTFDGSPSTHLDAWWAFVDYCVQDVVVEREIHRKLSAFEPKGEELELFHFTLRMNERGVPVNLDALSKAQKLVEEEGTRIEEEFQELTGLRISQRDAVFRWFKDHGYPGENLQKATREKVAENPPSFMSDKVLEALELKSKHSFAAVKKVLAMYNRCSDDGYIRGEFAYCGASRTGRWASRGVNLQNLRRPSAHLAKKTEEAYEFIAAGATRDEIVDRYGDLYEVIASCVRHFIEMPKDEMILQADYSNIEARVVLWLADQKDSLAEFDGDNDPYLNLASLAFGIPLETLDKDSPERNPGKVGVLGAGFGMAWPKFIDTCIAWKSAITPEEIPSSRIIMKFEIAKKIQEGKDLTEYEADIGGVLNEAEQKTFDIATSTIRAFRQKNEKLRNLWSEAGDKALLAMRNPEQWFAVESNKMHFKFTKDPKKGAPYPMLLLRVPSGRVLCYPKPRIQKGVEKSYVCQYTGETKTFSSDQITFYGPRRGGAGWGIISTYGGDLVQSATQTTARDILRRGVLEAQKKDFSLFSLIHDEVLSKYGDMELLKTCLTTLPEWMDPTFPLEITGSPIKRYTK